MFLYLQKNRVMYKHISILYKLKHNFIKTKIHLGGKKLQVLWDDLGFSPYKDDWCLFFFWLKAGIHTCPVRRLRYGWWTYVLGERTTPRLKENSKIFCIDGNIASGKGALAQKLADRLGRWSYRLDVSGSRLSCNPAAAWPAVPTLVRVQKLGRKSCYVMS